MPFKISSSVDSKALKAKKNGIVPFILTTKTLDRDSEVILPSGAILDNFKKNPVFVWVHDIRNKPPIGKILIDTIVKTEEKLTADVLFDIENDEFAKLIYGKYVDGFLNAGSIRFSPKKIGEPILVGQKGATIEEWELLEFSAVPVPANPNALNTLEKSLESDSEKLENEKALMEEIVKFLDVESWSERLKEIDSKENFTPSTIVKEFEYDFLIDNPGEEINLKKSFAIINEYEKDVPEDAMIMDCSDFSEIPHPHAGKTVVMKEIVFVPPVETEKDITYWLSMWKDITSDSDMIEKFIKSSTKKLSDQVAVLGNNAKSINFLKEGFGNFMVNGAFTENIIKNITKSIQKQADDGIVFENVVDEVQKLLYSDGDYIEAFRKKRYSELKEIYRKEKKQIPEFIESRTPERKDAKKKKSNELILAIVENIVKNTLIEHERGK